MDARCVLEGVVGVSKSLAAQIFNFVIRTMVTYLYDRFVRLPETEAEWRNEAKEFLRLFFFMDFLFLNKIQSRGLAEKLSQSHGKSYKKYNIVL